MLSIKRQVLQPKEISSHHYILDNTSYEIAFTNLGDTLLSIFKLIIIPLMIIYF